MPIPMLIEFGVVLKDYEELFFVLVTFVFSLGLMVAFGAWWSR